MKPPAESAAEISKLTPQAVAAQTLEWPTLLSLAAREARTSLGQDILVGLSDPKRWAQNLGSAQHAQAETQEVAALLDREALWGPLAELTDPLEATEKLARGSVLELVQLHLLRRWLYAVDAWSQFPREDLHGELFKKALQSLNDPGEPLRILEKILTPEGELSERASPKLAQLYAEIRVLKKEIARTLEQLIKTFATKGVLQENFSDVRDGRYVLPIKISAQGEVDGTLYEASASRQTVFIEPREIAPLNNRLRQRQNELLQEIYLILADTSKKLQPFAGEIEGSSLVLAHWDAVQAKARLGRHCGAKPITVTQDRAFSLRSSAHPLLWWNLPHEEIIRNDLDFGDPVRSLLLTGPNTGGKTVLLKTLGLAGICARTGFPFPAVDHPTIPFFENFFADVGDSQSIEKHLSSFSGHLSRFRDILENITDQSLVLIDELNTATDPEEGAALGRAFLETIMSRGAMIVTTTHDPQLKILAISDRRILNASMEFDESSRMPTYRMQLGVPGRSRALETAERLGIPQSVLTLARSYLTRQHLDFEGLLGQLERDSHEAARAKREAVSIREDAERLKKEWTERTESSVSEMLSKTRQRLRRIVEQAQDDVRSTVQKLDELRSRKDVDSVRKTLNESLNVAASRVESALHEEAPEISQTLARTVAAPRVPAPGPGAIPYVVGAPVRVPKWKSVGTVLEIQGNKVKVSLGALQVSLSLSDLETVSAQEASQVSALMRGSQRAKGSTYDSNVPPTPEPQLDLRGMRLEEAMSALERYLDQAYRSGGLTQVNVIHGLGTGALREGCRQIVSKLPYVKEFRDGGAGQGGSGATLVEFTRD